MAKRVRSQQLLYVLAGSLSLLVALPGSNEAAAPKTTAETKASPPAAHQVSLPQRLEAYVAALNAGDVDVMFAFYEDGVTADFRSRRSEAEDTELYKMLTGDLGQLRVMRIMRDSDDSVTLVAHSARKNMPVHFIFGIKNERIDNLRVQPGEPPTGRAGASVQLPKGLDDAALTDSLDEQLKALADDDRFSGVVLLARHGEPFFYEAFGLANRETRIPNLVSTAFDIGSITKIITRTAVAQLLQDGKLALEGRIVDYLPDYPNKDVAQSVTVQHLLDHSSGLGDIFNERWEAGTKDQYIEPEDFFPLFADEPLKFQPGSSQAYSNAGYTVLGAIVAAASGLTFSEYLETRIFLPAGMADSGLELRDGRNPAFAVGYAPLGPDGALVDNLDMLPAKGCPAGSSMHTAEDLLKLDRALRNGKLLNAAWTAWFFGRKTVSEDAGYSIGIAGGGPGVSAGLESNNAVTVVVLSNFDPPTGEALAAELFQALLAGGR